MAVQYREDSRSGRFCALNFITVAGMLMQLVISEVKSRRALWETAVITARQQKMQEKRVNIFFPFRFCYWLSLIQPDYRKTTQETFNFMVNICF
jgi:hypothetical protein